MPNPPALFFVVPVGMMECEMAGGWAPDGAVQDQIDASIKDEVDSARARLGGGKLRHIARTVARTLQQSGVPRCRARGPVSFAKQRATGRVRFQ
jgi:hypothetical protein